MPSLCLMKFSKTPKVWRFSSDGPQYRWHAPFISTDGCQKIQNSPQSLEFLDSSTQYRRHGNARAINRFSAGVPIPWSGGCGAREPRPASPTARSSPAAAGSTPAIYFLPVCGELLIFKQNQQFATDR
jgi:hypothetical protein